MELEVLGVTRDLKIGRIGEKTILCENGEIFKTPLRDDQLNLFLQKAKSAFGVEVTATVIAPQYYYFMVRERL